MMSLRQIADLSREQAIKASKLHKRPYLFEEEDRSVLPPFPFPNIGDYRPKGWELGETYFVDKTGMGSDDEPALTINQFVKKLKPGFGYAIIEEGEFQVVIGEFKQMSFSGETNREVLRVTKKSIEQLGIKNEQF